MSDQCKTSCCRCEVCYCGPNCACTETLCLCEASSVLNSLEASKTKKKNKKTNKSNHANYENDDAMQALQVEAGSKNGFIAEWKVAGMTCCSKGEMEAVFQDETNKATANKPKKETPMVIVDTSWGTVRAVVKGHAHANQLTRKMEVAGFSLVRLEGVTKGKMPSPPTSKTPLTPAPLVLQNNLDTKPSSSPSSSQKEVQTTPLVDTLAGGGDGGSQALGYETIESQPSKVVELAVSGMTCSMCSQTVTTALQTVPGVVSVSVSLATTLARIEYNESPTCNPTTLAETVEDIGFTVVDVFLPEEQKRQIDELEDLAASNESSRIRVVEFAVEGMTCSMCSNAIQTALLAMPNVKTVAVSLSTNVARVEYEESTACNALQLQISIEEIGYTVIDVIHTEPITTTNNGQGGRSSSVIQDPEDRLQRLLRLQEEKTNSQRRAFVWSLLGAFPILVVTMIIPHVLPASHGIRKQLMRDVTVLHHTFCLEALILFALATPVQFLSGYPFYKSSYYGIFVQGSLGMDVLVALGTSASYGYAAYAMWVGQHEYHFFETSAVLICFVLLGKWMNALAVRRTSEALTKLMQLQAKTALKVTIPVTIEKSKWNPLTDSYEEALVSIQTIQPGDIVKVLKGASIPADGVLLHGEMSVDESMITGESVPVLKTPGSIVLGGTICVESGSGHMDDMITTNEVTAGGFVQVTGVGSSTALAQIVSLVQEAQSRQVPIQHFADTVSAVFVPTVVTISILTFMVWYAICNAGFVPTEWYDGESPATFSLMFSISCLVISCPCALGLATPTAVMVGTGVGARHGILMKGGETLEMASHVDAVVFDKTGTLTRGKPVITDFVPMVPGAFLKDEIHLDHFPGEKTTVGVDEYLLWLLGSLERNSEHPLASAVVAYAETKLKSLVAFNNKPFAQPTNFRAFTGRGASGTINGNLVVSVGNRAFATLLDLHISPQVEDCMQSLERQGKTAFLAAVNGTVCVVMGIADELKADAPAAVMYLKSIGVDVWMVTGDNRRTANAIARKLNLPANRVIAEALPVAKVEQVRKLQAQGRVVAMIGDGVNDSPALAEADVGMSLGTGAEIAAEASDIVLVKGNVVDVCTALHLTRAIFRRIQLNFLWALVYNSLGIPLAAGVFYPWIHTRLPPTVAALAMALSSISVVCSSLALRLYRPPNIVVDSPASLTASRRRYSEQTRPQTRRRPRPIASDQGDDLEEPLLERV